jgi:drug/metabolite transporter (DMT)-like permease
MKNFLLYIITAFIWGSTWLAIKFQLGLVDPQLSVAYRFGLSGLILLIFCWLTKRTLNFTLKQHGWLGLQGVFMFSFHYWLVYMAEIQLPSGLVSVIFSTTLFWNIVWGRIFINLPINKSVVLGGIIGLMGIFLVFKDEVLKFSFSNENSFAFLICILGALMVSLGNIISTHNQRIGIPVFQINAFGMIYGSILMMGFALIMGTPFTFDLSVSYVGSMLYLAIFGSIIAFSAYLTLLGNIGPDRAGYVTLLFPIIALALSTIFEGYAWTLMALFGVVLILGGNLMVLRLKGKGS